MSFRVQKPLEPQIINWELFHGTLSAGDYRIVKGVSDFGGSGDFTRYYLAAEFSID